MRLLADKNRWLAEARPKMAEEGMEDGRGRSYPQAPPHIRLCVPLGRVASDASL